MADGTLLPDYSRLSTETKPTGKKPGVTLIETDTGDLFEWSGSVWSQTTASGGIISAQGAGERGAGDPDQYAVGNPECKYWVLDEVDGVAVAISGAVPAVLYSVYVNETLAGGTIILEDGSGSPVVTLPDTLAAGTFLQFEGMMFDTDLTANAAAALTAGNITIGWRAQ